eukprot:145801_1
MSQKILDECLRLFEHEWMPQILPNPKYRNMVENHAERHAMTIAGRKSRVCDFSDIGRSCYYGNYELFLILIKLKNIINFNTYFEGKSKWSLMHFVIFGRKRIITSNAWMTTKQLNQNYNHMKIARYLIDNGLYIDIQSKWGYSGLHEAVINTPDLYFAEFLLQNGAQPNLPCVFGEIPLTNAIISSLISSVKLLCEYGADPRIKNEIEEHTCTPLYLGRSHIEISTILYNQKRKLELSELQLECENISYCTTCNVSRKITKLYQCAKCRNFNVRYCSKRCQKHNWELHKINCKTDQRKIDMKDTGNELVFDVLTASDTTIPDKTRHLTTIIHEYGSKDMNRRTAKLQYEEWDSNEFHKRVRKFHKKANRKLKRAREKFQKEVCNNLDTTNRVIFNERFIVKIQMPKKESVFKGRLLVYNKKRTYTVCIEKNRQKEKFDALSNMVRRFSPTDYTRGCKAFFHAWIDSQYKLHVVIDRVLALQPW